MQKRTGRQGNLSRRTPRGMDANQWGQDLVRRSTEVAVAPAQPKKDPVSPEVSRIMAMMGRKGGKIGGIVRAARMTPAKRREMALKAARARWDKPA